MPMEIRRNDTQYNIFLFIKVLLRFATNVLVLVVVGDFEAEYLRLNEYMNKNDNSTKTPITTNGCYQLAF
jgi:hypothetical protein